VKYLLVFVVAVLLAWRWRTSRTGQQQQKRQTKAAQHIPVDMVACAQCGLHISATDAVKGSHGSYCSVAHRTQAEPE
jgi:uncharacterized protein